MNMGEPMSTGTPGPQLSRLLGVSQKSDGDVLWSGTGMQLSGTAWAPCGRDLGQVQLLTPVIPATWEAEAGRSRFQSQLQ